MERAVPAQDAAALPRGSGALPPAACAAFPRDIFETMKLGVHPRSGQNGVMKGFPDLPPVWFVVFWGLNWGLAALWPGFAPGPVLAAISWGLVGLGLALILWSALWFWRRKTTIEPHHTPTALIVEGPYRLSRNPIYLGLVLILLGSVIGRGQLLGLVLVAAFLWVLNARFAIPEENGLRATFGGEAEAYLKATRRWL